MDPPHHSERSARSLDTGRNVHGNSLQMRFSFGLEDCPELRAKSLGAFWPLYPLSASWQGPDKLAEAKTIGKIQTGVAQASACRAIGFTSVERASFSAADRIRLGHPGWGVRLRQDRCSQRRTGHINDGVWGLSPAVWRPTRGASEVPAPSSRGRVTLPHTTITFAVHSSRLASLVRRGSCRPVATGRVG
jgi:hypothetical protein